MEKTSSETKNTATNTFQYFNLDTSISDIESKNKRRHFSYKRRLAFIILCVISIILSILTIINCVHNSIRQKQLNALTSSLKEITHKHQRTNDESMKLDEIYSSLQAEENHLSIEYENSKKSYNSHQSLLCKHQSTLNALLQEEKALNQNITIMESDYAILTEELIKLNKVNEEMINISKNINENIELLKTEYEDLIIEKKRLEKEQNAQSVVGNVLHSDIITTIEDYNLLLKWLGLGSDKILIQKYRLKGENSIELVNNNKAILQESKPIIIILKLSTGQKFGLAILTPLPSLRKIVLNDESSFMFSFDKMQKYSSIECKQNMKTTYIISFSSKTEIHIPDACFKDDNFFNIEDKIKFYKTKKHFQVEYLELYQLYDIL